MVERRLDKRHKAAILALYNQAQDLQRQIQEAQENIDELIAEWAEAYGLPEGKYAAEGRPDGEVYLIQRPGSEAAEVG